MENPAWLLPNSEKSLWKCVNPIYSLFPLACFRKTVFVILLSIFALTPVPIRAHSHPLPRLSALTPVPICAYLRLSTLTPAHSRSLSHELMHKYLRENEKSQKNFIISATVSGYLCSSLSIGRGEVIINVDVSGSRKILTKNPSKHWIISGIFIASC